MGASLASISSIVSGYMAVDLHAGSLLRSGGKRAKALGACARVRLCGTLRAARSARRVRIWDGHAKEILGLRVRP